jgi:hypothetical protein
MITIRRTFFPEGVDAEALKVEDVLSAEAFVSIHKPTMFPIEDSFFSYLLKPPCLTPVPIEQTI